MALLNSKNLSECFLSRFRGILKQRTVITLPEFKLSGNLMPKTKSTIFSAGDEYFTCEGVDVFYEFIQPEITEQEFMAKVDMANFRDHALTLFIHCQFLDERMTNAQLEHMIRDGGYQVRAFDDEPYETIEIYTVASAFGQCQYGEEFLNGKTIRLGTAKR